MHVCTLCENTAAMSLSSKGQSLPHRHSCYLHPETYTWSKLHRATLACTSDYILSKHDYQPLALAKRQQTVTSRLLQLSIKPLSAVLGWKVPSTLAYSHQQQLTGHTSEARHTAVNSSCAWQLSAVLHGVTWWARLPT